MAEAELAPTLSRSVSETVSGGSVVSRTLSRKSCRGSLGAGSPDAFAIWQPTRKSFAVAPAGAIQIGSTGAIIAIRRRSTVPVRKGDIFAANDQRQEIDDSSGISQAPPLLPIQEHSLGSVAIEEEEGEEKRGEDHRHIEPLSSSPRNMRRDPDICEFQDSVGEYRESLTAVSGWVSDYLVRLRARSVNKPKIHELVNAMLAPRDTDISGDDALQSQLGEGTGYTDCLDMVCQEKAIDSMKADIAIFWKCQGHPDWQVDPKEVYLRCCRRIVAFTRETGCIRDAVTNSLFSKKLVQESRQRDSVSHEPAEERWDRLQEFWTHVHMDERTKDNLLQAVPETPSGGLLSKVSNLPPEIRAMSPLRPRGVVTDSAPVAKDTFTCPDSTMCASPGSAAVAAARASLVSRGSSTSAASRPASRPWPTLAPLQESAEMPGTTTSLPDLLRTVSRESQGSALPGERPNRKCWKSRAARSHCSYNGMDWRAQQDFQTPPTPATSSKDRLDSSRPATTSRISGWSGWEDEIEQLTYRNMNQARPDSKQFVGKWWARGVDIAPFLKPKHIPLPKSTSLPSLRMDRMDRSLFAPSSLESWDGDTCMSDTASFVQTDGWRSEEPFSKNVFSAPWKTNDPKLKSLNAPPKQYLRACKNNRVTPKTMPFLTGHSKRLEAADYGLLDPDLFAITDMVRDASMEEVDLSGNLMLTEKSLLPFIDALPGAPLRVLRLCRLAHAGHGVLEALVMLINARKPSMGVTKLLSLNLSGVLMAQKWHLPLCKAVMDHPTLQTLELAETGLGGKRDKASTGQTVECIGTLLESATLKTLNIGWNAFTADVLTNLGSTLIGNSILTKLIVANCFSAGASDQASSLVYFAEFLSRDRQLTHLDLSLNCLDYRGALVIEEALMNHRTLTDLDMTNNPLGVLGMRSILRLLATGESGLQNFHIEGCSQGVFPLSDDRHPIYTATNPGGRYSLDLEKPYSRALLRMLYKTCDRFALSPEQSFTIISTRGFGAQPFQHATKDKEGFWSVPDKGKITLKFTIERAVEGALKHVNDDEFGKFLDTHNGIMRFAPGFKKVVPLFAQWRKLDGLKEEQMVFIDALSKDFHLSYAQIKNLCASKEVAGEVIWQLLPCIVGGVAPSFLSALLTPTLGGLVTLRQKARELFLFNVENPTGHYTLNLENATNYAVAEWIMLIDRWESGIAIKHGHEDTSQRGNHCHLRNEQFQGRPLVNVQSIAEWTLPSYDTLDFDYSSTKRAPHDAPVLDKVTLSNLMISMQGSGLTEDKMVECLRLVSHTVYLRSGQMRELFGILKEKRLRILLFVIFFNRIVDMWNEKLFRVRFEDPQEFVFLCEKLGYCTCLPIIQPENMQLHLNFKYHDQRLAANIFIGIANKERRENVVNIRMTNEDGSIDPLPLGLPKSWELLDKMPKGGVFQAYYRCSADDRKFQIRKALFETYGFWKLPVEEHEVCWWADITQAPDDVLEFLMFVCRQFKNTTAAFKAIDGEDGNGTITRQEFEAGCLKMGFKIKVPKNSATTPKEREEIAKDRLKNIFRYLDPSGEGGISAKEFQVLELLWNEYHLCITEFVQFINRTIGDDMDEAWNFFDEDGSGEIDKAEWLIACQNVGYFGPVLPILHFLDMSGNNCISAQEFMLLEAFMEHEDEEAASP